VEEVYKLFLDAPLLVQFGLVAISVIAVCSGILRRDAFHHLEQMLQESSPERTLIISQIQKKYVSATSKDLERINTPVIVDQVFSQVRLNSLFRSHQVLWIDSFTRNLPNWLLVAGLIITLFAIIESFSGLVDVINTISDEQKLPQLQEQLGKPLSGIAEAFLGSLVAVFLSTVLAFINLLLNTRSLIEQVVGSLEDYLDNDYSSTARQDRSKILLTQMETSFNKSIKEFSNAVSEAVSQSIGENLEKVALANQEAAGLAKEVYTEFFESSDRIKRASQAFVNAADVLDKNNFPERLTNASRDLKNNSSNFEKLFTLTTDLQNSVVSVNQALVITREQGRVMADAKDAAVSLIETAKHQQQDLNENLQRLQETVFQFVNQSNELQVQILEKAKNLKGIQTNLPKLEKALGQYAERFSQEIDEFERDLTVSHSTLNEMTDKYGGLIHQQAGALSDFTREQLSQQQALNRQFSETIQQLILEFRENSKPAPPIDAPLILALSMKLDDTNNKLTQLVGQLANGLPIKFFGR